MKKIQWGSAGVTAGSENGQEIDGGEAPEKSPCQVSGDEGLLCGCTRAAANPEESRTGLSILACILDGTSDASLAAVHQHPLEPVGAIKGPH
eukprot:1147834-Pelagomonas_calceolata.AAC.4